MEPTNLDLDTKLPIEASNVEVGYILSELQEGFPNGFYSKEATIFLRKKLGAMPDEFRHYGQSHGFYKILAEAGFLETKKEKPKKGRHSKFHYRIKPNILAQYKKPEYVKLEKQYPIHTDFGLPEGLVKLINSHAVLLGTSRDKVAQATLEQGILTDEKFLRIMANIKMESPEGYASMGGTYLDRLQQLKGTQK